MTADEILAKAQVVRQNLEILDSLPQESLEEFTADARNLHAALHLLQTAIQASPARAEALTAKPYAGSQPT